MHGPPPVQCLAQAPLPAGCPLLLAAGFFGCKQKKLSLDNLGQRALQEDPGKTHGTEGKAEEPGPRKGTCLFLGAPSTPVSESEHLAHPPAARRWGKWDGCGAQ